MIFSDFQKYSKNLFKDWIVKPYRLFLIRVYRLKAKPIIVARGLAVGVFAGCFPFFGIQTIMGILLAALIKGSKIAAIAGTWISNPLTYVPIFMLNFKVGKTLLGVRDFATRDLDLESISSFMELGYRFAITLLTGSFVVGIIASICSYFACLYFFKRLRQRKINLDNNKK